MNKLIVIFLLATCNFYCAPKGQNTMTIVTMEEKENALGIAKGKTFQVELPVQTGTGYDWELESPVTKCSFVSAKHGKNSGVPGSKAIKTLGFTANETGTEVIKFIYRRSFDDKSVAPADEKLLTVTIF
jgi:predicted secreted protein